LERLVDDLLVHLVGEVGLEGAAVDLPLTGAGDDAHAGHGLLAATGRGAGGGCGRAAGRLTVNRGVGRALRGVLGDLLVVGVGAEALELGLGRVVGVLGHYWATWVISKGLGCWA